jgi:predicted ArsR family transcriptional regulator
MLESLFGNKTTERILFFIERYGEGYPNKIANTFRIRVNAVQQQMRRLENGGIVVSRLMGKVRIYQFNPRYPFVAELKALIKKAITFLPESEIQKYYMLRTRPRKEGKPR